MQEHNTRDLFTITTNEKQKLEFSHKRPSCSLLCWHTEWHTLVAHQGGGASVEMVGCQVACQLGWLFTVGLVASDISLIMSGGGGLTHKEGNPKLLLSLKQHALLLWIHSNPFHGCECVHFSCTVTALIFGFYLDCNIRKSMERTKGDILSGVPIARFSWIPPAVLQRRERKSVASSKKRQVKIPNDDFLNKNDCLGCHIQRACLLTSGSCLRLSRCFFWKCAEEATRPTSCALVFEIPNHRRRQVCMISQWRKTAVHMYM